MTDRNTSKTRTWMIFGAAAAFVLIAGIAAVLLSGSEEPADTAASSDEAAAAAADIREARPVEVSGAYLPPLPEAGADVALGLTMPELTGQSFDGTPVEIKNDGRPKIIMFLAHW